MFDHPVSNSELYIHNCKGNVSILANLIRFVSSVAMKFWMESSVIKHNFYDPLVLLELKRSYFNFFNPLHISLVYTCKYNSDCYGNGYCKREFHFVLMRTVGVCKCDPNYNYALDCSIYGCKYHSTACFTLFKIPVV